MTSAWCRQVFPRTPKLQLLAPEPALYRHGPRLCWQDRGMERVTGIGGYFMRAADPAALGAWYRDCLGLDADENGLWRQEDGPTVFAAFESGTEYFGSRASRACSTSGSATWTRCSRSCATGEPTWLRKRRRWRASAGSAGSPIPRATGSSLAARLTEPSRFRRQPVRRRHGACNTGNTGTFRLRSALTVGCVLSASVITPATPESPTTQKAATVPSFSLDASTYVSAARVSHFGPVTQGQPAASRPALGTPPTACLLLHVLHPFINDLRRDPLRSSRSPWPGIRPDCVDLRPWAVVRVKVEAWMNFLFLVYSYTKLPG